jgi:hypothetical protein
MAGRNEAPKPAKPKPASTRRHQTKSDDDSVNAMSYRKKEKDVADLLDVLAELTRDLRPTRSAAPAVPSRRSRSPSRGRKVVSNGPLRPSYPRGNPLTESMEFTDRNGTIWLAYIEGTRQDPPRRQRRSTTALPDRHLRFDSATESRFTSLVPAGAPFLAEARLQSLLDEAQPEQPLALTTGSSAGAQVSSRQRVIEWSTRAVGSSRDAIEECSRRWQETASRREALRRHILELRSGAANRMHGTVEVLLGRSGQRPAARA